MTKQRATRAAVRQHVEAFNAHDTARLLQGLDEDVVWATGSDVFRGRKSLDSVFDDWLWAHEPSLQVVRVVVDGDAAAVECIEHMTVEGQATEVPIAVFLTVSNGLFTSVRVYREGTADLPSESM